MIKRATYFTFTQRGMPNPSIYGFAKVGQLVFEAWPISTRVELSTD